MANRDSARSKLLKLNFSAGDVLTFQMSDGRHGAAVCVQIGGRRTYDLVATTFIADTPPTMEEIYSSDLAGVIIESGYDAAATLSRQPGVDTIWQHQNLENFFFGLAYMLITFKDMSTFGEKFRVIGNVEIKAPFVRQGGYSYFSTFEKFERVFMDLAEHMKALRQVKVPVALLRH